MAVLSGAGLDPDSEGLVSYHFWQWYRKNENMVVLSTRRLKIIRLSIRVRHLEFLFVQLFGPEPFA